MRQGLTCIGRAVWLCLGVLLMFAAGCQAYKDGASRTVGQFTDDARIQAQVKTALIADDDIKGWPINVEVYKGVVSLYGEIATDVLRARAVEQVAAVRGVVKVEDHLRLASPD